MRDTLSIVSFLVVAVAVGPAARAGTLESYLTGEMAKLEALPQPVSLADHEITYPDGSQRALAEMRGKVLLVNLWSKGCVPCRAEMKDFARLQRDLGGERFEVVALPMEKRGVASARKILKKWGVDNLEPYGNDPQALARVLYRQGFFTENSIAFTYPTTYVVDKGGMIVAVRVGFLHWDTPEARALITALTGEEILESVEPGPGER